LSSGQKVSLLETSLPFSDQRILEGMGLHNFLYPKTVPWNLQLGACELMYVWGETVIIMLKIVGATIQDLVTHCAINSQSISGL
jgi:hypothetical protein